MPSSTAPPTIAPETIAPALANESTQPTVPPITDVPKSISGNLPAWPVVTCLIAIGVTLSILGGQFVRTRSGRRA